MLRPFIQIKAFGICGPFCIEPFWGLYILILWRASNSGTSLQWNLCIYCANYPTVSLSARHQLSLDHCESTLEIHSIKTVCIVGRALIAVILVQNYPHLIQSLLCVSLLSKVSMNRMSEWVLPLATLTLWSEKGFITHQLGVVYVFHYWLRCPILLTAVPYVDEWLSWTVLSWQSYPVS